MKALSKLITGALAAGLTVMAPAAFGQVACDTGGIEGGKIDTLGEWSAADGGCYKGDKLYKLVEATRPANPFQDDFPVSFAVIGAGAHQFVFGAAGDTESDAILLQSLSAYLEYTVEVYNNPGYVITALSVDTTGSNLAGGSRTATKDWSYGDGSVSGTITSVNGADDTVSGLNTLSLRIKESFSRVDPAALNTAENTTLQQPPTKVPEPATLALLGIGLAGLGVYRRRKA